MSLFPAIPGSLSPGVTLERRQFLQVSASALAAWALGGCARPGASGDHSPISFDDLLERAFPEAQRLVRAAHPDEDAYLHTVAALAARLKEVPPAGFPGEGPVRSVQAARRFPLVVHQFHLEPGAAIPFHDHRQYNGVLMGVEGEVRVRNFDILGGNPVPPPGKTFQIRETHDGLLVPGRLSTLSRTRDNVHDVRAGKAGARLLDIFTFFEEGGGSYYLDVDAKSRDPEKRIYDAAWKA